MFLSWTHKVNLFIIILNRVEKCLNLLEIRMVTAVQIHLVYNSMFV